jgi:predicted Zn-dependent protease
VVFHWDSGTRVRVFLGDEPATRAEALASAFDAAAQAWTAAAPLAEVRFVRAASAAGADVVIAWSDGPFPVETEGCPPSGGALGVTTFCLTPERDAFLTYPLVGGAPGDVRFLVTISPTLFENAVVLRRLVTHEIGHTLGLFQHSPNPPDLMFGGALSADVPTEADRATLFTLYHTESDL